MNGLLKIFKNLAFGILSIPIFSQCLHTNNKQNVDPKLYTLGNNLPVKPNIIFILVDDLGYGDLHCFNENSKINTSNINQLAKEGTRFINAHFSSAVSKPSR